jgi:hypothetical protein
MVRLFGPHTKLELHERDPAFELMRSNTAVCPVFTDDSRFSLFTQDGNASDIPTTRFGNAEVLEYLTDGVVIPIDFVDPSVLTSGTDAKARQWRRVSRPDLVFIESEGDRLAAFPIDLKLNTNPWTGNSVNQVSAFNLCHLASVSPYLTRALNHVKEVSGKEIVARNGFFLTDGIINQRNGKLDDYITKYMRQHGLNGGIKICRDTISIDSKSEVAFEKTNFYATPMSKNACNDELRQIRKMIEERGYFPSSVTVIKGFRKTGEPLRGLYYNHRIIRANSPTLQLLRVELSRLKGLTGKDMNQKLRSELYDQYIGTLEDDAQKLEFTVRRIDQDISDICMSMSTAATNGNRELRSKLHAQYLQLHDRFSVVERKYSAKKGQLEKERTKFYQLSQQHQWYTAAGFAQACQIQRRMIADCQKKIVRAQNKRSEWHRENTEANRSIRRLADKQSALSLPINQTSISHPHIFYLDLHPDVVYKVAICPAYSLQATG